MFSSSPSNNTTEQDSTMQNTAAASSTPDAQQTAAASSIRLIDEYNDEEREAIAPFQDQLIGEDFDVEIEDDPDLATVLQTSMYERKGDIELQRILEISLAEINENELAQALAISQTDANEEQALERAVTESNQEQDFERDIRESEYAWQNAQQDEDTELAIAMSMPNEPAPSVTTIVSKVTESAPVANAELVTAQPASISAAELRARRAAFLQSFENQPRIEPTPDTTSTSKSITKPKP